MSTIGHRSRGFTILELFAVLSILGLIAFLFFPVWIDAKAGSRNARCSDNLSQIGRAIGSRAHDHDGRLPGCQHNPPSWREALIPYVSRETFICPEEPFLENSVKPRQWTYALSDFLTPHPYGARELDFSQLDTVPSPSQTLAFAESAAEFRIYDHFHFADSRENGFSLGAFGEQVDVERHSGTANYLFVDGHVESLAWSSGVKPKLSYPNSRFVHPAGTAAAKAFARR